jgi:hypothetical protein
MNGLREFWDTTAGKLTATGLLLVGLAVAAFMVLRTVGPSEAVRASRERLFICAQTGKPFEFELKEGTTFPTYSPHSGKQTGYPAELCYWTKDGQSKDEPTPVLLNSWVGKAGPTFCPDCGRLVVGHNPPPGPDVKPPPTQAEYRPTRAAHDR